MRRLTITIAIFLLITTTTTASSTIYHGDRQSSKIALTFDDGPNPDYTPLIRSILNAYDINATFFIVGISAQYFPQELKNLINDGHELANHSYTHTRFDTLKPHQIRHEIQATNQLTHTLTGQQLNYFRPPGGRYNKIVLDALNSTNMQLILWDVNSGDYNKNLPIDDILNFPYAKTTYQRPYTQLADTVIKNSKGGSIILFHNTDGETIKALPLVIESLQNQGYTMGTVTELLNEKQTIN